MQINIDDNIQIMKQALDASMSGIVITDNTLPDNPIIYINNAFENISGYRRDEIIGHNCRFLQHDDRSQTARSILRKAIKNSTSCKVEIRNYRKDGTLFWNELYMAPVIGEGGIATHFIGVQNDITHRKNIQLDLERSQQLLKQDIEKRSKIIRESEDYLASIIQTVRESLVVLSPEMKVLSVNDYYLKTFKVSINVTKGLSLFELGNGQWNNSHLRELLENILVTNIPVEDFVVEHEFPFIGKKLMLLNAHRIELSGVYRDRILIAIEDITERHDIEQRKDDFLSIASHELKTPLTTIRGYVQLLDKLMPKQATEKYRNVLAKTSASVARLNALVSELLDVSRIQTGNIELHKDFFDFDQCVYDAVDGIVISNETHLIKITGAASRKFWGDESQLVQVVTNLINNAIKYSPNSAEVYVHLSTVSNFLKFEVRDTGLGISKDQQKKVFERFYRVAETQKQFPGLGIGLYVCHEIIVNHGGTIWVESEKGNGSVFSFTLPIKD